MGASWLCVMSHDSCEAGILSLVSNLRETDSTDRVNIQHRADRKGTLKNHGI